MNVTFYFQDTVLNQDLLLSYGFQRKDGMLYYAEMLNENPMALFLSYDGKMMEAKVMDMDLKEPYLPFESKEAKGAYLGRIREETLDILLDIKETCGERFDCREKLLSLLREKRNYQLKYPFSDEKNVANAVLTEENDVHWFGIFLSPKGKSLSSQMGEKKVDLLVVKLDPEKILALVDNVRYFPGYHMNKRHWMSILLDKNTDLDKAMALLDESHDLVYGIKPKRKKSVKATSKKRKSVQS